MRTANPRVLRPSGSEQDEGWRTPAQRDLDRILYASAYRRLAGVTQVAPAGGLALMHNRLTHTLKVEQVARRLAQGLAARTADESLAAAGGLDPDVAQAAAAAHDLGHPPFGHVAENELQHVLRGRLVDSFEGNAQTFRIVSKLSMRKERADGDAGHHGLDLTLATLAATAKYPWCKGEHAKRNTPQDHESYYARKWGAYETERSTLEKAVAWLPEGRVRSLEADIMDFSDDVTYAVHDIEDFFRVGLIPLHEIGAAVKRGTGESLVFDGFWDFASAEILAKGEVDFDPSVARALLYRIAPLLPERPFNDADDDRLRLHRFISEVVSVLQTGVVVRPTGAFDVPRGNRMLVEVLKQLTWYFVIEHPGLAAVQRGQRKVVRELVTWLEEWAKDNDPDEHPADRDKRRKVERRRGRELPSRLLSYLTLGAEDAHEQRSPPTSEDVRLRAVVDFVASLTEPTAYELHQRLGGSAAAVLDLGQGGR